MCCLSSVSYLDIQPRGQGKGQLSRIIYWICTDKIEKTNMQYIIFPNLMVNSGEVCWSCLFLCNKIFQILLLSDMAYAMLQVEVGEGGGIPPPSLTFLKGYMQKETVRSSKLRKLRNFEFRIGNLRKLCRHRKLHNSVKY